MNWVFPILAGAAAGLASSWLFHRAEPAPHPRQPPAAEVRDESGAGARADSDRVHLAAEVMGALAQSWPAATADKASPPEHPSEDARQAQMEQEVANHEGRLARLRLEPRVGSWARPMEQRMDQTFRAPIKGLAGHYESGECRAQSCSATFSWPSRGQALGELRSTMARAIVLGCARELVMPPAEQGSDRYQATMLLDCQGAQTDPRVADR